MCVLFFSSFFLKKKYINLFKLTQNFRACLKLNLPPCTKLMWVLFPPTLFSSKEGEKVFNQGKVSFKSLSDERNEDWKGRNRKSASRILACLISFNTEWNQIIVIITTTRTTILCNLFKRETLFCVSINLLWVLALLLWITKVTKI